MVGQTGWQLALENNKQAFIAGFVARSRFANAYPTTLTPTEFVNALFTNAGVTPSPTDRDAAISEFSGAGDTAEYGRAGRALRRVAENSTLAQQEFNKAFVLMQYFGYLRRNPNDAPEAGLNFDGYNFWLGQAESVQRQLRQRRNGQGIHHLQASIASASALSEFPLYTDPCSYGFSSRID